MKTALLESELNQIDAEINKYYKRIDSGKVNQKDVSEKMFALQQRAIELEMLIARLNGNKQ